MNIWLVMLLGGLITFGMRFSLIYLLAEGRLEIPDALRRALHYVPPAVFSALVFPELFLHEVTMSLSPDNPRLMAGLVAVLVAWLTRNTLTTIVAGMIALLVLELLF